MIDVNIYIYISPSIQNVHTLYLRNLLFSMSIMACGQFLRKSLNAALHRQHMIKYNINSPLGNK